LAFVTIGFITVNDTSALIMARISTTYVDGTITKESSIAMMTVALERVGASDTITMDTRIVVMLTLIFLNFASMT
jgi:hypothetical protein